MLYIIKIIKPEYEPFVIGYDLVMKHWYTLNVFPYSLNNEYVVMIFCHKEDMSLFSYIVCVSCLSTRNDAWAAREDTNRVLNETMIICINIHYMTLFQIIRFVLQANVLH